MAQKEQWDEEQVKDQQEPERNPLHAKKSNNNSKICESNFNFKNVAKKA